MDVALERMIPKVTKEMNDMLAKPFTTEDILEALTHMYPTKASGPDGLPAVFFQKHWQSVKERVLSTCLHILNNHDIICPLNHT